MRRPGARSTDCRAKRAGAGRSRAEDGDEEFQPREAVGACWPQPADQALVVDHRGAVLVPIRMVFPLHRTKQGDELRDGRVIGRRAHRGELGGGLEHDVRPEVRARDVERGAGIAAQVLRLRAVVGDRDADRVVDHGIRDVRELGPAVALQRDEHAVVAGTGEGQGVCEIHSQGNPLTWSEVPPQSGHSACRLHDRKPRAVLAAWRGRATPGRRGRRMFGGRRTCAGCWRVCSSRCSSPRSRSPSEVRSSREASRGASSSPLTPTRPRPGPTRRARS